MKDEALNRLEKSKKRLSPRASKGKEQLKRRSLKYLKERLS